MIKKICHWPHLFPSLLLLLCLFLAARNYTPGTFLSGWDTLHPEFNFPLNFQRLLFSVWRPEQGFGAVSGHSAMADLPRVFILWLFHFVFPVSFLRYSYVFLCLILGPLGFYYLVLHLFKNKPLAFLGSLFYLLNLSTLQQFYVPFEMFPTQWALLPWVIYFSFLYLQKPSKKSLLLFCLATIFSTPQAYAAHLWYPFFGAYLLFVLIFGYLHHRQFKAPLIILGLTLVLNSFWLLPNLYYIKTSSQNPEQNQQNRLHSQEFLLQNRLTGTIGDTALIKGFYFNWEAFNFPDQEFQQLMPQWRDHVSNFDVQIIGYALFLISLGGLILAFRHRHPLLIPLTPFFIIPFILLCNRVFPFNLLFDFLLRFPLLQEVLRFIFTKLSTLLIFGQAIFFAYGLETIIHKFSLKAVSFVLIVSLFVYVLPMFNGQLISPLMRVNIPQSYFDFWKFAETQPSGRTLALPLNDPAGWIYTTWGYQGSGLIWFGYPQSITDRDNDRWQFINEEAYREFNTSLYSYDAVNFLHTLQKYKINYILWDQSNTTALPKNRDSITAVSETTNILHLLQQQGYLTSLGQFGTISYYRLNSAVSDIELDSGLPNITPFYHWSSLDPAYTNSDYLTDSSTPSRYFPFRQILTSDNRLDSSLVSLTPSSSGWQLSLPQSTTPYYLPLKTLTSPLPSLVSASLNSTSTSVILNYQLPLPQEITSRLSIQTSIPFSLKKPLAAANLNDSVLLFNSPATIVPLFPNRSNYLNGQPFDLGLGSLDTITSTNVALTLPSFDFTASQIFDANYFEPGLVPDIKTSSVSLSCNSDITHNFNLHLSNLSHHQAYLIAVKSSFQSGLPLRLCFQNSYSGNCIVQDELSHFSTPSWDFFFAPSLDNNIGYNFSLSAISVANVLSQSHVEAVSIIPIPYDFLSHISTSAPAANSTTLDYPSTSYFNHSLFAVNLPSTVSSQTLVFNQSFNSDWLAFTLQGFKPTFIGHHLLINNWANGWQLSGSSTSTTVYIFFWPQLLETFGLFLVLIIFVIIFFRR